MTRASSLGRRFGVLVALACAAVGMAAATAPAAATAAPVLAPGSSHVLSQIPAGGYGLYTVTLSDSGDAPVVGNSLVTFTAPVGMTLTKVSSEKVFNILEVWTCSLAGDGGSATCEGPLLGQPGPGEEACKGALSTTCRIHVMARVDADVEPGTVLEPTIEACNGGAATCTTITDPTPIEAPAQFHIPHFDGFVLQQDGSPATQAGSHPFTAQTEFEVNQIMEPDEQAQPQSAVKDVIVDLPPGLVGNTTKSVIGTCTATQISTGFTGECPNNSQVGVIRIGFSEGNNRGVPYFSYVPVYNLQKLPGHAATFAFNVSGAIVLINASVRSGGDYGLRTVVTNNPMSLPIDNIRLTFWGVPAASSHDPLRGDCMDGAGNPGVQAGCPAPADMEPRPFLSLPTSCSGPQETKLTLTTWESGQAESSFLSHDNTKPEANPIGADGCNTLDFSPSLEARPTTNVADSPTGLSVDIHVPQNVQAGGTSAAHLRNAIVSLPKGLVVNPSAANGLGSCSPGDVGLTAAVGTTPVRFTSDPAHCPDPSKLGTVEIDTPLLEAPLRGAVYLATPHENPFKSLLALYIAVYDPASGIVVKLPGRVNLDPATGQLTAEFEENPQLPFEDLRLKFFEGPTAALRTPASCGIYRTTSTLTPWSAPDSGPPATPFDTYAITRGPNEEPSEEAGEACPGGDDQLANKPAFEGGAALPIAGSDSPLVINLRRRDGTQDFASVQLSPPPGLIGKLAGIPSCSDSALVEAEAKAGAAEQAAPSCPSAAEIGNVTTAVGAGQTQYNVPGKAYLTGPYKGAPLGLAIVTPAVAGPFDLGTIVVRAALEIDPKTAQITATSDTIPSILEGIPLDIRTISIRLDREGFIRNPTSCSELGFSGSLTSTLNQTAPLFQRFQLGECDRLGFKPKLTVRLKGGLKRRGHPRMTATLWTRPGDANIESVAVVLPPNELLDNDHIGAVCTRVQFAASTCPAESVYGFARVKTPILNNELSGPVYLRSSSNPLPDLVPDLRGPPEQPIRLEAAGRTHSVRGGLAENFEYIPDAAFSKLELNLGGGRKGLLVNSKSLCAKRYRATVTFTAHNGLYSETHPLLKAGCPRKTKQGGKQRRRSRVTSQGAVK